MSILSYRSTTPKIGKDCFVADTAIISGDVIIGEGSSVWYSAVLRAEAAPIRIGRRSNIQDNCTVHTDIGYPTEIGDGVTVGHNAVIHGAVVGSNSLIGIGAVLLNGSKVGNNCVVGAGSLLLEGAEVPDGSLVLGSPAKVKRLLTGEEMTRISQNAEHYYNFRADYLSLRKK